MRRCGIVFGAVVCVTLVMVGRILCAAAEPRACHRPCPRGRVRERHAGGGLPDAPVSEKKTIYAVLAFTAFFFAGLMGLTLWAANDVPTVMHSK